MKIAKTNVWIEDDIFGSRHVVVQHEGCDPFTYASFHYDHRYTTNAGTHSAAKELALQLGATDPVQRKSRTPEFPTTEKVKRHIENEPLFILHMPDGSKIQLFASGPEGITGTGIRFENRIWQLLLLLPGEVIP